MQIVVDANPLISILIKPGKPIDLLFIEELNLVAPELLFKEIENNKQMIINKSNLSEVEINQFIEILKKRITIYSEELFLNYRNEATKICPDEKDIIYFALALYLKCSIWSNEKKLKEQNYINVYATHELIDLFSTK